MKKNVTDGFFLDFKKKKNLLTLDTYFSISMNNLSIKDLETPFNNLGLRLKTCISCLRTF